MQIYITSLASMTRPWFHARVRRRFCFSTDDTPTRWSIMTPSYEPLWLSTIRCVGVAAGGVRLPSCVGNVGAAVPSSAVTCSATHGAVLQPTLDDGHQSLDLWLAAARPPAFEVLGPGNPSLERTLRHNAKRGDGQQPSMASPEDSLGGSTTPLDGAQQALCPRLW